MLDGIVHLDGVAFADDTFEIGCIDCPDTSAQGQQPTSAMIK